MNKTTFENEISYCCSPSDFQANRSMLKDVKETNYEVFLACIKYGSTIHSAFQIVKLLEEITNNSSMDLMEAFLQISTYKRVVWFINENPMSFT